MWGVSEKRGCPLWGFNKDIRTWGVDEGGRVPLFWEMAISI